MPAWVTLRSAGASGSLAAAIVRDVGGPDRTTRPPAASRDRTSRKQPHADIQAPLNTRSTSTNMPWINKDYLHIKHVRTYVWQGSFYRCNLIRWTTSPHWPVQGVTVGEMASVIA
ncbi:hypothetical protein Aca07nite_37470 [Actinoplanes capillaceus]|uniref:Uncharacterized protein n=1 Tax=Actinoplanes campanulatus TaxID=113559 RepID=A0ABQ3WJS3_9ACTN|nr:hypothetical protein Aca07nite_37470 [Actinoplanes capillaceus]